MTHKTFQKRKNRNNREETFYYECEKNPSNVIQFNRHNKLKFIQHYMRFSFTYLKIIIFADGKNSTPRGFLAELYGDYMSLIDFTKRITIILSLVRMKHN